MDAKRSAGVALEVNLRNSSYTDKQGGPTVTLKPRIDIRSLKKGTSGPTKSLMRLTNALSALCNRGSFVSDYLNLLSVCLNKPFE